MTTPFDHAALYGESHDAPRTYAMHGLASSRVWAALSVGGPAVLMRKADIPTPNEDALAFAEEGQRVLMAVADGHYGHHASHDVIERLDDALAARATRGGQTIPADVEGLLELVVSVAAGPASAVAKPPPDAGSRPPAPQAETAAPPTPGPFGSSETTLTVAVLDRARREVVGVAVGDSSAVVIGLDAGVRWLTTPGRTYVDPSSPSSYAREVIGSFRAPVAPGELVVVFSDGVNECKYGDPSASIGARHLEALWIRCAGRVERFVESLAALALSGVDGHPGGEDNVAIVAARV